MVLISAQVIHAFSFTLGCFAIHSLRSHADRLTAILTCLVLVLAIVTIMMAVDRLTSTVEELPVTAIDLSQVL